MRYKILFITLKIDFGKVFYMSTLNITIPKQDLGNSFNSSHKGNRIKAAIGSVGTPERSKSKETDEKTFIKIFDGDITQNMTSPSPKHMPKVGGPKMQGMSKTIKGRLQMLEDITAR